MKIPCKKQGIADILVFNQDPIGLIYSIPLWIRRERGL